MTQIEITCGDYTLHVFVKSSDPAWPFFISNKDGEGASLSQHDLEAILKKAFEEHMN